MSNVKGIIIRGEMPFNVANDKNAAEWLGILNGPSIGIRISWGERRFVPNGTGKTAMYRFVINGQEAIRWDSLNKMIAEFEIAGAIIESAQAMDIEDLDSNWVNLLT